MASGHKMWQFFQYILDGMYHMEQESLNEKKKAKSIKKQKLARNGSSSSLQSFRASSVASTPNSSRISTPIAELFPSEHNPTLLPPVGLPVDDTTVDLFGDTETDDCICVSSPPTGYLGNPNCDWEPFDGVRAPPDWFFNGFLSFICFGPASSFYDVSLKIGGNLKTDRNAAKDQPTGRAALRKEMRTKQAHKRDAGGPDRGLPMHTKVHVAAVAQGEDDADQRHQDRRFAILSQSIGSMKSLMNFKLELMKWEPDLLLKSKYGREADLYAKKIEKLASELTTLGSHERKKNKIVAHVLDHAKKLMGLTKAVESPDENTGTPTEN